MAESGVLPVVSFREIHIMGDRVAWFYWDEASSGKDDPVLFKNPSVSVRINPCHADPPSSVP
jgi:hypothetical protein